MNFKNLKTNDFDYILPDTLIATEPLASRDESRLLVVKNNPASTNRIQLNDTKFNHIIDYLNAGDLIIFNDSKVIKARLFGNKLSGGKIEILIERILDTKNIIAHVRSNKTITIGLQIIFPNDICLTITEKLDGLFKLTSNNAVDFYNYLEQFGNIPLPPYMHRTADLIDDERYQTVYANTLGSVAAPTAGLHFTQELLDKIAKLGVQIAHVTLHVGSGTFKPVTTENIHDHKMHSELYSISQETIDAIIRTKASGHKVIAVGTTSLRTLEAAALTKEFTNFDQTCHETNIFIPK